MAKSAWIKDYTINQELKNNGIEIQIDDDRRQFGDIYVAKTGITWCKGKCDRANGTRFSFDELDLLSRYKAEALAAARNADRDA